MLRGNVDSIVERLFLRLGQKQKGEKIYILKLLTHDSKSCCHVCCRGLKCTLQDFFNLHFKKHNMSVWSLFLSHLRMEQITGQHGLNACYHATLSPRSGISGPTLRKFPLGSSDTIWLGNIPFFLTPGCVQSCIANHVSDVLLMLRNSVVGGAGVEGSIAGKGVRLLPQSLCEINKHVTTGLA